MVDMQSHPWLREDLDEEGMGMDGMQWEDMDLEGMLLICMLWVVLVKVEMDIRMMKVRKYMREVMFSVETALKEGISEMFGHSV